MGMEVMDKDARMWGMLCHVSAFAGYTCIPFANVLGPLVVWLVKREGMPFVDDQGKEALNFNISMLIYVFVASLLTFVFIGYILVPLLLLTHLILTIMAAVKANSGIAYRYPITIRLVK